MSECTMFIIMLSPTDLCVCVGGKGREMEGEREGGREGERERKREGTSGLSQSVRRLVFYLFCFM